MDQIQAQLTDIQSRLTALETKPLDFHTHTQFDMNQVYWSDIALRKVYVSHTIIDTMAATAADYGVFFIAPQKCLVTKVLEAHKTAGTDGGAVTLNIEKLTSGQAPDAGVTTLSTAFNLKAAINTVQTGVLNKGSSISLAPGDRLCMKDVGTLTAVANVTVLVEVQF